MVKRFLISKYTLVNKYCKEVVLIFFFNYLILYVKNDNSKNIYPKRINEVIIKNSKNLD